MQKSMSALEWGLLVALSMLWGGSFFFAEVALMELPPLTVVLARLALAAPALLVLVFASGRRLPSSIAAWRPFVVMGLANNVVPMCLIVAGQTQIAGGLAAVLNATTPLFTVLLAHLWTADEKLTAPKLLGVLAGFGGVVVMIGPLAGLDWNLAAQGAVLAAALSYALAGIYGRRLRATPPLIAATGQVTAAAVLLLPLTLLLEQPWTLAAPGLATWGALAGISLLSTALAYILYFRILATAGASNLLLVTFLIPVSAILLTSVFLGEQLAPSQLAGMALIALGLAFIDGRLLAGRRARLPQRGS